MNSLSPHRHGCARAALGSVLGLGLLLAGGAALAQATSSPTAMSEMPDILNGERHVLRIDDLFVGSAVSLTAPTLDHLYDYWKTASSAAVLESTSTGQELQNYVAGAAGSATPLAAARAFDLPRDVVVTFAQSNLLANKQVPLHLQGLIYDAAGSSYSFTLPASTIGEGRAVVAADFNADGYQDLAFHWGSTEATGSGTAVGTAADVTNAAFALRWGAERVGGPAFLDLAAGDVDGDGSPELVGLYHTATELRLVVRPVDPATLNILDRAGNDLLVAPWKAGDRAKLAVGKFDDNLADAEIAVLQAPVDGCATTHYCSAWVRPYDVVTNPATGGYSILAATATDIGTQVAPGTSWNRWTGFAVATGHLDWFGGNPRDQIAFASGHHLRTNAIEGTAGWSVVVVDFLAGMKVDTVQVGASRFANYDTTNKCVADLAIGRFDPPSTDPNGETPANALVALLLDTLKSGYGELDCGKETMGQIGYAGYDLVLQKVDPATRFKLSTASSATRTYLSTETVFTPPRLAAADLQGRSLVLGAPIIVAVPQSLQPEVVVNAPPMHIDYFTPTFASERPDCFNPDVAAVFGQEPTSWDLSGGKAAGCLRNVSAYPGHNTGATECEYCTTFTTTSESNKGGQQQGTASHTWSNEIGGSAAWTFGSLTPNLLQKWGLGFEVHGSAKWMGENTVSQSYSQLSRTALSLATATGPDDYVLYSARDTYLYMYPVIGKTDDNGNAVYLQYSIPDQTQFLEAEASALQWWQPEHEVGNLFSYPGNLAQLLSLTPDAEDRSGPFPWTSQVQKTQAVTWTQQQTEEKSIGSSSTMSWDVGGSVSAAAKIRKIKSTIKGEVDYDHHESNSQQYLNTTTKSLTKSSGFSISTEAFTLIPESTYRAEAHVFGSKTPTVEEGYWDDQVKLPDPDKPGSADVGDFSPDLHVDGQMQVGYWVSMLPGSGFTPGTLWATEYAQPDIGLQHPKRYRYVGKWGSQFLTDWWTFNPRYKNATLSTMPSAEFFKMKGFFINPAHVPEGTGPQMVMATEGDQLRLQARVYNFSLANLPAGAQVKVRFYAHKLAADATNTYNQWVTDGCMLIGEDTVGLGAFRSDVAATTPANRAFAKTIFDTTGHAGEHLIFWVVAWAEDSGGNLISERERHGLAHKPPAGCPGQSILGIDTEFYSNNVGYYDQPFVVIPQGLAAELADRQTTTLREARAARAALRDAVPFSISHLAVTADRPWVGELWELETSLSAGDGHALGINMNYSGEGPGGRADLTRLIPVVRSGCSFVDKLGFRPLRCGAHSAWVTARPAFQTEASARLDFEIACRPQDVTAYFVEKITDASLAGKVTINAHGRVVGPLSSLQSALETAQKLAEKGAIAGACEQYARALERTGIANGSSAAMLAGMIANVRAQLGCSEQPGGGKGK